MAQHCGWWWRAKSHTMDTTQRFIYFFQKRIIHLNFAITLNYKPRPKATKWSRSIVNDDKNIRFSCESVWMQNLNIFFFCKWKIGVVCGWMPNKRMKDECVDILSHTDEIGYECVEWLWEGWLSGMIGGHCVYGQLIMNSV